MADRFKALVHYICHRMSDDPARLGLTRLNKILWYSDVWMYKKRGSPITGEGTKYVKHASGPVAQSLLPVLNALHREQIVVGRREQGPGGTRMKFFSLKEPDLSAFSAEEISVIDYIISEICYEHTAKSITNLSHDLVWRMHEIGEEMPLYRSHVMELGEIADDDINWAKQESRVPT